MLIALALAGAMGGVVDLSPSRDGTLYEDPAGQTANGAGQYLFAGVTQGQWLRRGLIHFDVASVVPAGATIQSVSLTMHCSRTVTGSVLVGLHSVLGDWGEGASVAPLEQGAGGPASSSDATWLHRYFPGLTWTNPGGDFSALATDEIPVGATGFYTWSGPGLVSNVQSWLDVPAMNFGWAVLGDEATLGSAKRFDSREHPLPELRPVLRVSYIPGPGASEVLVVLGLAIGRRRKRPHFRINGYRMR